MAIMTIRPYEVGQEGAGSESLENVLYRISQLNHPERDKFLTEEYIVRLSRYERLDDSNIVSGEFIRIRETNFPVVVSDQGNGIRKLPVQDENIGQGAAFRYNIDNNLLYMQSDSRVVATGRAIHYLNLFVNDGKLSITPCISGDAWKKLNEGIVRTMEVGIVSHDSFMALEDDGDSAMVNLASIGRSVAAHSMYAKISMGHNKGGLSGNVKDIINNILESSKKGLFQLGSLKAKIKEAHDIPAESINLLEDILFTKENIDFPRNDPEENYKRRKKLLKDVMNRDELKRQQEE